MASGPAFQPVLGVPAFAGVPFGGQFRACLLLGRRGLRASVRAVSASLEALFRLSVGVPLCLFLLRLTLLGECPAPDHALSVTK